MNLAVAAAIGLLIGLERERRKGEGPGRAAAGIRTFTLVALAGGLSGALENEALAAIGLAFVGAAALASYLVGPHDDPGLTTEVAMVTTFLLGLLAWDDPALASSLGVATAILLAARQALHRLVRQLLTESELHDLLLFAAAAVVVLPILPNEAVGPYDVLNPFRLWRLLVLVLAISGGGYAALRVLGPRFGLPVAGLAGGFVSSAATIGSMAALARRNPALARPAAAGAVLSTVATFVQMVVVLSSGNEATLRALWPALAGGGALAAAIGALTFAGSRAQDGPPEPPGRAFDLKSAAAFALTITLVLFISAALADLFGDAGLVVSAALAGFADAHAAGAAAAALAEAGTVTPELAAFAVVLAMTTNTITKVALSGLGRQRGFAVPVIAGLGLVMFGLWGGWFVAAAR